MPRSLVVLAALAFGAVAHAQSGTVRGKIADSAGAPIAGAVVTVDNTTLRATTTADGRYAIRGVPAGDHTLRVRMIRYTPMTKKVTVGAGAEVDQDFTLVHSTQVLAPVDGEGHDHLPDQRDRDGHRSHAGRRHRAAEGVVGAVAAR